MYIQKAGTILVDINNKKIGLIYREKQNDYSFPKGHVEVDETHEECAIRETEEETGRICHIINKEKLNTIKYTDAAKDECEAHYYIAVDDKKSNQVFDKELVHELVWKDFNEVEKALSYQNLKELWNEARIIIKKELGV